MSDTKRIYAQSVVEFRKPFWSSFIAMGMAVAFAGLALSSDKGLLALAILGLPVLYNLADFLWSLRNPYLSIAPWKIVYRPRFWQGPIELSAATIAAWRVDGKKLVFERTNLEPVKVKLEALSKKDWKLAIAVLRERGYGKLES